MPVVSLPLFKQLKSFQGDVVVQVEGWDNVEGRLPPALLPQKKVAFWLDIPSKTPHSAGWYLGTENPALALALCRLGEDLNSDPLSVAWHLVERGVPFHTWFKRRPHQVQPLENVRISPQLVQFRPDPQHRFTSTDYNEYVRFRRRLLDGPAGQAALKAGGISWRLATEDIGTRCVISNEPSQEALLGQRVLRRDNQGGFLVDDGLGHDEAWAICGEYEMGISTPLSLSKLCSSFNSYAPTGEGNQKGRKSWWPPSDIWEDCFGTNGWSDLAEDFFQRRLLQIYENFTPIERSKWRGMLHPSGSLKKARNRVHSQSAEICGGLLEGGVH